jgi:acyl-CoA thioesterase FadM
MRVRPLDLDVLWHMNNGVYFSLGDLGRYDLLIRSGVWNVFKKHGWYPVVASSTIAYRKSLDAWMKYELHSRMAGVDERNVYMEQRFVVDGEIYARLFTRARFLKRSGGQVPLSELKEALGVDFDLLHPPAWLAQWAEDVALPSPRAEAPNTWRAGAEGDGHF